MGVSNNSLKRIVNQVLNLMEVSKNNIKVWNYLYILEYGTKCKTVIVYLSSICFIVYYWAENRLLKYSNHIGVVSIYAKVYRL
jgi:hypothetical protein